MSQYVNEGIFRDRLSKHGVHVELGTEPASVEQDATGVTVYLKHAGVDEAETARFSYVIGADGARGKLKLTVNESARLMASRRLHSESCWRKLRG